MSGHRSAAGALLALAAAAMFGVSGAVAAGVFDTIDPARVAQARSLIAAVVLVIYAAYRGVLRPDGGLGWFAILGLNLALVTVTFYWAIERLGVGPGATVQFLGPIFVLVWIAVVRREQVSPVAWVASIGAVIGVGLVTMAWALRGSDALGLLCGLVAAVLFAGYLIYGERLGRDYPPSQIAAWGFVFASVFWAIAQPWWSFPYEAARTVWVDLAVVGLLGTAIPFVVEFNALKLTSSGVVGIVATAEPAIGAVAAAIMLGQQLEPVQWFGVLLVALAVAAVQRWGIPESHPTTPVI